MQLYDVIRTAHLERAIQADVPPTILFSERRYDFDRGLAKKVDIHRCGIVGSFVYALRHDINVLEISEPLVVRAAPRSVATIAGANLRSLVLRRARPAVVSYAIENKDPRDIARDLGTKSRVKWRLQRALIPLVWSRLDRIAFGTEASRQLYRTWFVNSRGRPAERLVPALPSRDPELRSAGTRRRTVVFLGDFSRRKGIRQLLVAWPIVARADAPSNLLLIGKGALTGEVEAFASGRTDVTVRLDPPRDEIRRLLHSAKVLALPSQPTPRWREQVGLPIVEALGSGCEIVTTSQTGLAEWLREHGHRIVKDPTSARELAQAINDALDSSRTPSDIAADLPNTDGRSAAEQWLLDAPHTRPGPVTGSE